MRTLLIAAVALFVALPAQAAKHADWPAYMKANRYKCPGPFDSLAKPRTVTLNGKAYTHTGHQLTVKKKDADKRVVIGVMSAMKDVSENTQKNVADSLSWFRENGVEWVVVNGDIAVEELDLEDALELLGASGFPILLTLGNSESRSSFARAYAARSDKYPNLVNGTWVRQVIADDAEFWTLPGYYSKSFVYQGAGCRYKGTDVDAMSAELSPSGDSPIVLVSHGPPRGVGKKSIDVISDRTNVGDEAMGKFIDRLKIKYGIFGHILESGGRAVRGDMKTPIPEKKSSPTLFVNAGSVSGDPWGMNDGSTSYGMAMIITIEDGAATYQVKRFESRF